MKAVILAGGYGTRISEESGVRPKPMVEIGGKPILWHIMKMYAHHGITDFIICCGYKGNFIKKYFADYFLHHSDVTFYLDRSGFRLHHNHAEPWQVTLVDTGLESLSGGRLRRVRQYLDESTFCFTYGDGVSSLDIRACIAYHRQQGLSATVTAVRPPGRFGAFNVGATDNRVTTLAENATGDSSPWINGGFFVLEPRVFDYLTGDETGWEKEPLERLAQEGQLAAYRHDGFWQPMDTIHDRNLLEALWQTDRAPWKMWAAEPMPAAACLPPRVPVKLRLGVEDGVGLEVLPNPAQ